MSPAKQATFDVWSSLPAKRKNAVTIFLAIWGFFFTFVMVFYYNIKTIFSKNDQKYDFQTLKKQ